MVPPFSINVDIAARRGVREPHLPGTHEGKTAFPFVAPGFVTQVDMIDDKRRVWPELEVGRAREVDNLPVDPHGESPSLPLNFKARDVLENGFKMVLVHGVLL